jgi:hypothetical protein
VPAEDITPQEAKNQVGEVATATGKEGPTNLTNQSFPKESCWPDKVHLTKAAKVSVTVGTGGISSILPIGTEVWVFPSEDNHTLTIQTKNPDLKGKVPVEDTDFLQLANAIKAQKEQNELEKNKRQEKISAEEDAERGEMPKFLYNPFNGHLIVDFRIEKAITASMKDPDSFIGRKGIEITPAIDSRGRPCWKMVFTFSGKNSFGGLNTEICTALLQLHRISKYQLETKVLDVQISK